MTQKQWEYQRKTSLNSKDEEKEGKYSSRENNFNGNSQPLGKEKS